MPVRTDLPPKVLHITQQGNDQQRVFLTDVDRGILSRSARAARVNDFETLPRGI